MNEQIRLLQAEVRDDLQAIDQAYEALDSVSRHVAEPEGGIPKRLTIVLGYAERLERLYRPDIEGFLAFLDGMAGQEDGC